MFRRFYGYMKNYRKYGLFSCACVALEVMFELVWRISSMSAWQTETEGILLQRESRCAYWRL